MSAPNKSLSTQALELALRHKYDKVLKTRNPFARKFMEEDFEKTIKKIPKTSARIASVVKNVSSNKTALATLKRTLNVNTVKKFYKPEFFFDLLRNAPNVNAMNAMLESTLRRESPESLLRVLISYEAESFPAMPMAVARIVALRKISIEKLVRIINEKKRYDDAAASTDILAIFKAIERSKLDFSKVRPSDMFLLLVERNDEFLDSIANDNNLGLEPMHVLTLLAFMIERGAPRVPLEDVFRYVVHYDETNGAGLFERRELYKLLRLYDRETLKDATILPSIVEIYARDRVVTDMRTILDRIDLPKNVLDIFFEAFSENEDFHPSIPAGDIEYLLARGAVVTRKTVEAFEKYAKQLEGANVSNAYRNVLRALNDVEILKNYKPFSNAFKNVVDNVRKARLGSWLEKRDGAARPRRTR